jgi:hypothetical protein
LTAPLKTHTNIISKTPSYVHAMIFSIAVLFQNTASCVLPPEKENIFNTKLTNT